jgi:hypothetical protein
VHPVKAARRAEIRRIFAERFMTCLGTEIFTEQEET